MKYRGISRVVVLLVVALLIMTPAGQALDTGAIGANPAYPRADNERSEGIFIQTIQPGESAKDGVEVVNPGDTERTVLVGVVDSNPAVDGSFSCRQNSEKKTAVGKWVQLESAEIKVAAQSTKVVDFTITVPKGTNPGEHNGCITIQDTKNVGASSGSGVLLGFRSAIRLVVNVPGKITKQLDLVKVEVSNGSDGTVVVAPTIKNSGNVSLDVIGRAQIEPRLFGEKSKLQEATFPVLNEVTTSWRFEFKRPFWGGFYKARASLSYNANTADTLGESSTNERKKLSIDTPYTFIIPAPKAIAIYIAVVLLFVLAPIGWLYRKRLQKTQKARTAEYVVQRGDTLASIAETHQVNWKQLAKQNNLKAPYILTPGQGLGIAAQKPKKIKKVRFREQLESANSSVERQNTPSQQAPLASQPTLEAEDVQRNQVKPQEIKTPSQTKRASVIYAPRPQKGRKTSKAKPKSAGYSWANPGSDWAPRVISEEEIDQLAETKAERKKKSSKRTKK